MKLRDVSRFWQKTPVTDGYTGASLFSAHTTPHDDHTSSGATARRRTMTVDIDKTAPARRVVDILGEKWIVGNSNLDAYSGTVVKKNFGLKKATDLAAFVTPAEAALAAAGTEFYIQREFYRDAANPLSESDLDAEWNVFCPFNETLQVGAFFRYGGRFARVRSFYTTVDEYLIAEADQLDTDARQAATFTTTGAINVITDLPTSSSIATNVLQFDDAKFYRFRNEPESSRKPGDKIVLAAQSVVTAPAVGMTLTLLGQTWRVVQFQDELDAWAMRVRRA